MTAYLAPIDRPELESIRPSLECARDARCDPDRIARLDLDQLVVELDLAGAPEDHVDLLGLLVSMRERRALPGAESEMREARLLGAQRGARYPGFPAMPEAVCYGRILDIVEVHPRIGGGLPM